MELCMVTAGSVNGVWQENLGAVSGADILVFGFNGIGLVSYKKELNGETEYFHDLARLSKQLSNVVICGCDTDTYGIFRHSAVIADRGRILGVSDMAHTVDDSEFVAGGNFRVYETSAGKIGIIVAEDLFFPEVPKILSLCDADLIVCLYKKLEGFMPQIMLRSSAFANGVTMAMCAENYAMVSDVRGRITAASASETVRVKIKKEKHYHLISTKRRGLYREFNSRN